MSRDTKGGMNTTARRPITAAFVAVGAAAALWTGVAAAGTLPGCASGAAPGRVVFTVSVSASGAPFVSSYVASAPAAGGTAGCAAPSKSGTATISVIGPGVALYPQTPVPAIPSVSTLRVVPTPVSVVQAGSYLMLVPVAPGVQLYQIAPGYYVVRSTDPTQPPSVIMSPLPSAPQAPYTGPIPSVIH